jgi:hypothetical protein
MVLPRCGASSAEREFPSDKVYRRNDRGIVGVESLSLQGLAFVVIDTFSGRAACRYGSPFVTSRHRTRNAKSCVAHRSKGSCLPTFVRTQPMHSCKTGP